MGRDVTRKRFFETNPKNFTHARIRKGPVENDCPIHVEYFEKILQRNHDALLIELGNHPDCKCWVQAITKFQYRKLCGKK